MKTFLLSKLKKISIIIYFDILKKKKNKFEIAAYTRYEIDLEKLESWSDETLIDVQKGRWIRQRNEDEVKL